MGNDVFANGREISCKSADGKSICAFPDVCFTPPQSPATPPGVPIPYPNTGFARDTTSGSRTVKISGKEVMLKNKSYFKKSLGDEAGCAPKKGIITSVNRGKVYFIAWSMDVKYEGENVVRHMDLTTHNHASPPVNAPPQLHTALQDASNIPECAKNMKSIETECDPWQEKAKCPEDIEKKIKKAEDYRDSLPEKSKKRNDQNARIRKMYLTYAEEIDSNSCRRVLRCLLIPYSKMDGVKCPKQTGEHLIDKSTLEKKSPSYNEQNAPTGFTEGPSYHIATHGLNHSGRTQMSKKRQADIADREEQRKASGILGPEQVFSFNDAMEIAAQNYCEVNYNSGCKVECIKEQLKQGHAAMGVENHEHPGFKLRYAKAAEDKKSRAEQNERLSKKLRV